MGSTPSLQPFTEFGPRYLALQLHDITRDNPQLRTRGLLSVIEKYGSDYSTTQENVEEAVYEHEEGTASHFAIVADHSDIVIGAASIRPGHELKKSRFPLLPEALRGRYSRLTVDYPYAAPNILAWNNEQGNELMHIYYRLLNMTRKHEQHRLDETGSEESPKYNLAWTVESAQSPEAVHRAIAASGLERIVTSRFDDGANGSRVPPRGTLYADLVSDWRTSRGKQKELRAGRQRSRHDPGLVWP